MPLSVWAQTSGQGLIVEVKHRPYGDVRNEKIEEILNKAAVIELEQSGLKAVVPQESPEEFSPELKITCRYLEQQDKVKLEYRLQVAASGKQIAEVQIDASMSHFLDRAVENAVKELLHTGRDEINRIALAKREQNKREHVIEDEQGPRPVEAEAKVSGAYMLGRLAEYLPYALLIEGRLSYPLVQGGPVAWRLGGSLGMMRFSSAENYKAGYIKTLLPLSLMTELRLKNSMLNSKSNWFVSLWWTAGAALRLPHEDEMVDELLAPAFPYTNIGIGAQVPLVSDRLYVSAGFSGMGLFHLYDGSDLGKVKTETLLGINIDLGVVWRM